MDKEKEAGGGQGMTSSIPRPQSRRVKYLTSAVICFSELCLAFGLSFFAPTMTSFAEKFNTSLSHVTIAFTILTVTTVFSTFIYGFIAPYLNRQLAVVFIMGMMSAVVFIFPHAPSIWVFYILGGLLGVAIGTMITVLIPWTIDLWRDEANVFILAQGFIASIGSIISPLIVAPFLVEKKELLSNGTEITFAPDLVPPFSIGGGVIGLGALCQLLLYLKYRSDSLDKKLAGAEHATQLTTIAPSIVPGDPCKDEGRKEPLRDTKDEHPVQTRQATIILVALMCAFSGFIGGMEVACESFLPIFAIVSAVHMTKAAAAHLLFGVKLSGLIGRGLGIFLIIKIRPQIIICGNLVVTAIGILILWIGGQSSADMLWAASIIHALGSATINGNFFAYIKQHLHITEKVIGISMVTGSIVHIAYQQVLSSLVQDHPVVIVYVAVVSLVAASGLYGVIWWYTRWLQEEKEKSKEEVKEFGVESGAEEKAGN